MGKHRPERNARARAAFRQHHSVKCPAKVHARQPRQQTKPLRPARKGPLGADENTAEPINHPCRQHDKHGDEINARLQHDVAAKRLAARNQPTNSAVQALEFGGADSTIGLAGSPKKSSCAWRLSDSQPNRSTTHARAASPIATRSGSSASSRATKAANSSGRSHGTTCPVSGIDIVSAVPPDAPATTGLPQAWASSRTIPNPSKSPFTSRFGNTNKSHCW